MLKAFDINTIINEEINKAYSRGRQDVLDEMGELLKPTDAWIPVSSGFFPDDGECVQVTFLGYNDGEPYCNQFAIRRNGKWFWVGDTSEVIVKIVAWKRNCEPYLG